MTGAPKWQEVRVVIVRLDGLPQLVLQSTHFAFPNLRTKSRTEISLADFLKLGDARL